MDATEKLTIQALKEHDKVHPKFKAVGKSHTSVTSSSKELKEIKYRDLQETIYESGEHWTNTDLWRPRGGISGHGGVSIPCCQITSAASLQSNSNEISEEYILVTTGTDNSPTAIEQGEVRVKDGSNGRRARVLSNSNSDALSKKSDAPPKRSGMTFFRIVAATRAWQRLAKKKHQAAPVKPTVRYENTYKLGPDDGKIFSVAKAEDVLKDTFDTRLQNVKYHHERSKSLATDLATIIKGKIKTLDAPRYKIVCSVIIIENREQGMQISSRCIWNAETDNYATYRYSNPSLIAIGYVHAVYYE